MAADAARLTLLVSRLLDLARADMAEAVEVGATDIALPLRRVADAFEGSVFAVQLELPQGLSSVVAPTNMIEASVAGLIENSRQAGASNVWLSARQVNGFVELMVRDNGPGIPIGDGERIFEPFFTSRRVRGGTGLGLPIARSLLRAYESTIELDPLSDAYGATFQIDRPRCPERPPISCAR